MRSEPDRPEVSAIVVSHNSAATLDRCLSGLAGASVEAIVVDNASADDSRSIARAAGAPLIENGANLGFAAACNLGVARARGDFVGFVNPDAVVPAGALAAAAAYLRDHPELGAVGLPHRDRSGLPVSKLRRFPTLWGLAREALGLEAAPPGPPAEGAPAVDADWLAGSALVVRKDVYRQMGGMDESFFLFFEDIDLCERLRGLGLKVRALLDSEIAIEHDEQVHEKYHHRLKIYAWHRSCARYFEKHGRSPLLIRLLLVLRVSLRFGFWALARLVGRIDAPAFRARAGGYLDVLRFCAGRGPALPNEASAPARPRRARDARCRPPSA